VADLPAVPLCKSGKDTVESFRDMRAAVLREGAAVAGERVHTKGCAVCANWLPGDWVSDSAIRYVNFSMYPAPCQCRCIYCGVHKNDLEAFKDPAVLESYEALFAALDYALKEGMIGPEAGWQVSAGEITIHPLKDRILNYVKNSPTMIYTNCFIYDEGIAAILKANPSASINLSIDAGTEKTWHKIKGFDNFDQVTSNLVKYYKSSYRKGQITLKYIILPGINDNYEDFSSVIEIMKVLGVRHLTLARDARTKYEAASEDERAALIAGAGFLSAMLVKNKMNCDMYTFAPAEQEIIKDFAVQLIKTGQV